MQHYAGACLVLVICLAVVGHGFSGISMSFVSTSIAAEANDSMIVMLDAGHGGEDCGAIGLNGVYEKDINLSVTTILAGYLRAAGVHVIETRTEDRLLYDPATTVYGHRKMTDLANRAAIAERYPEGVFISIHMNSFPGESSHGLQVWYGNGDTEAEQLAKEIQSLVVKELQPDNHRKIKAGNGSMYLLDYITCPSVLVECGFLTNRSECEKLSDEAYQKELSFVLFCAIMNYLNNGEHGMT